MEHTDRWLDVLFGMGDDTHPYWLMAVRSNILIVIACCIAVLAWHLGAERRRRLLADRAELCTVLAVTALAAFWRFAVASGNLLDFAGIPYSRLLVGYKGHFATAQVYSLVYELTARHIEVAILLNRIAGVATVPLVYFLCRHLWRAAPFPALAAFLFAVSPLHILFSASDALPTFSIFLTALSYTLLAGALDRGAPRWLVATRQLGGLMGLALLTQVRYENALFLVPAAAVLLWRRRSLRPRSFLPAALPAAAFLAGYAYAALAAGLSFQNPVRLVDGARTVFDAVVWNPFVSLPVLLAGTLAAWLFGGLAAVLSSVFSWSCALALPVAAESGHGAARVFASWLVLILPISALGFAGMLRSDSVWIRAASALPLAYLVLQPVLVMDRFTARHLEILETELFEEQLEALPADVRVLIVPDDEVLVRRYGSTIEVLNKYRMTLAGRPEIARRVRLVGLTRYLEGREAIDCAGGRCAFFFGLPCLEQDVYPFAREQCLELLERRAVSPVAAVESVAAPFLKCSIYVAEQHERLCEPATFPRTMAFYQLE